MKNKHHLGSWIWLLATFATSALMADETEIFFADRSDEVPPNVLFLIDASGSMSQPVSGTESRMDVLKSSFQSVMDTAPTNLNIGLMHYANHGLGPDYWWSSVKGVNFPITPIDEKVEPLIAASKNADNLPDPATGNTVVRDFLASIVSSWSANGYTPIVDSLYEAARYYRGDSVGWGKGLAALGWAAHPLTYDNAINCTAYKLVGGGTSTAPPATPNNPTCIKHYL